MMSKQSYNRIKAALAEKGKTNIWLVEELDKNTTTAPKWCANDVQPNIETLFRIAEVLDVDVRELLVPTKKVGCLCKSENRFAGIEARKMV